MATKPQLSDIVNIYFLTLHAFTSMLLNELILAGHCASCYAVSADSQPTTFIVSQCLGPI